MRARVWAVGSLNVDVVCRVDRHPRPGETVLGHDLVRLPGGKGANQALAAADAGADVVLVAAVGDDEAGRVYVDALERHGVHVSMQVARGVPTGQALVVVSRDGENSIVVVPGANSALTPAHVEKALADLRPDDVVLLQLEVPLGTVEAAVRIARLSGATILLNPSPWRELSDHVLSAVGVLVLNEAEAAAASGLPASLSLCRTLGAKGADWDGLLHPAEPVEVVDSTGAGDAFTGALAAGLAARVPRTEALALAVRAGARACTHLGAQPWSL